MAFYHHLTVLSMLLGYWVGCPPAHFDEMSGPCLEIGFDLVSSIGHSQIQPMDSSILLKPVIRRNGIFLAVGFIAGVGMAIGVFLLVWIRPSSRDSVAVLDIGDGKGQMGHEILAAAAVLSYEHPVRIDFSVKGFESSSVETGPQKGIANMPCDWMVLELASQKTVMNEEVLSPAELEKRLVVYAESARLTQAKPFLFLACDPSTPGEDLVRVLSLLAQTKVDQIALSDYRWIFEPRPTPPPPPQIKPFAYPVELK